MIVEDNQARPRPPYPPTPQFHQPAIVAGSEEQYLLLHKSSQFSLYYFPRHSILYIPVVASVLFLPPCLISVGVGLMLSLAPSEPPVPGAKQLAVRILSQLQAGLLTRFAVVRGRAPGTPLRLSS